MKWIAWICPALLIAWTAEGQERLAIVGATIIDGNGGAPITNGTILIDGDRITAVGSRSDTAVPSDARVIDGSSKFVTPGFIDTNVHLSLYGGHSPERYETLVRYHNRQEDVVLEASQLHLKVGVTTVRDSYGVLPPLINVRDKIARGDEVGARMLVAGNIVGWGGPFSMSFSLIRESGLTVFQEQMNDLVAQGAGEELMDMTPSEVDSKAARPSAGRPIATRSSPSCSRAGNTGPGVTGSFSVDSSSSTADSSRRSAVSECPSAWASHAATSRRSTSI